MKKCTVLATLLLCFCPGAVLAGDNYAGALGGFAILSADGQSEVVPAGTSVSVYKPATGPALNLFAGRHLSDIFSVQANYIWNANDLILTSASLHPLGQATYEEKRTSSQQSIVGDLMVYFRGRTSKVRPYLSGGMGLVRLKSTQKEVTALIGPAILPPQSFSDTRVGFRVAVGADVVLRGGWSFRYSFSETMSSSPISDQLTPPGGRSLKNFQNLFGFLKRF